ncbi:aminotransferase class V-fold PLP-dependent enzyme [Alphaproteobacteria bacterium]|nr:aminotransferase class V-fold PLP-dependent enzyme [Alphaproteobacteria bacterium]
MPGKISLFVPGPTNMPDRVRQAMDISNEDHRAPGMDKFWHPLINDLKKVFETNSGQPIIFPGTGSSGWEAALTNLLSKGDKVLSGRFGHFSHLWIEMCKKLHIDVEEVDCEWGSGTPHEEFEKILSADKEHKIKAVLVTQNETSTGVTNDVKATRELLNNLNHPALLFVDGVSSIGSIKFEMDAWGVDVAVSGSQKGFMLPAGLAISCVSQKALEIAKTANLPRAYYDYQDMLKINETGYWPYTNPMPLLRGLREALDMMMEEGLDNIYSRHKFLAEAVQKASNAWGLKLCAKDPSLYSNTVTAIMVPEGIDSTDVVKTAYNKYNTSFGGGLNKVAGKLFRIGHLGDLNSTMILGAISTAELAMYDVGIKFELGSGVAAAIKHLKV